MRVIETTINCTLCPSYFGYFISYDISPLDYSFFLFRFWETRRYCFGLMGELFT